MHLVEHPFIKFDQSKPIYNFTYPLFRTISDAVYGRPDFDGFMNEGRIPAARTVSLYLHVPFCETICSFCPFQKGSYKGFDQVEAYAAALVREVRAKADFTRRLGGRIRSIYIGGGTPSILSPEQILSIGRTLGEEFDLSDLAEFTFECEPKSVSREKLAAAREIGVNRISFGVQTFTERYRRLFDLTSTRRQIEDTVEWSRQIIGRVGFDMLYGMHGQSAEEYLYDLKCATDLEPDTINLYPINNIAITPKLHKAYDASQMKPSSLSHRQVLRLFGDTFMRNCGYTPCNGHSYIKDAAESADSLCGMTSPNNFRYHKYLHGYQDDYVMGFGASAQSILGTLVTRANPNRTDYLADAAEGLSPKCHANWVAPEQIAGKPVAMRLPYSGFIAKDRVDWAHVDPAVLENLARVVKSGLIAETDSHYQLTRSGWQWYSNLMYFLLPQADRVIIDDYVADMMQAPIVLDGATEVCAVA